MGTRYIPRSEDTFYYLNFMTKTLYVKMTYIMMSKSIQNRHHIDGEIKWLKIRKK